MVSVLRLLMGVVLICRLVLLMLGEVSCGRREWIGWLARSEAEEWSQAFALASQPSVAHAACGDTNPQLGRLS